MGLGQRQGAGLKFCSWLVSLVGANYLRCAQANVAILAYARHVPVAGYNRRILLAHFADTAALQGVCVRSHSGAFETSQGGMLFVLSTAALLEAVMPLLQGNLCCPSATDMHP